jgi:hypothetical protein
MKNLALIIVLIGLSITSCVRNMETQEGSRSGKPNALKSLGTSGKAVYPLGEGKEAELFSHTGKGCLTHMWFGGNWENYGKLRLRVYVDGEDIASINMEMFLGHGIGYLDDTAPWLTKRIGKTGSPSGIYNNYHIPFGKHVRVTAQLPPEDEGNPRFWYIIHGTENLPLTFSGVQLPDSARLKLYKLENYQAASLEEFDIFKTSNSGLVYQVTVAAQSKNMAFLESIVRGYSNQSDEPILLSSGLEDYFLGTYYFNKGLYHGDEAGLTHLNPEDVTFSAYRFHEEDPLYFQDGFRLTLRCGEKTDRETWRGAPTNYTTYVWAYEW